MRKTMQRWSLPLLAAATLSGLLGFSGVMMGAAGLAKSLACVFLIAFLVPLIPPLPRKPEPPQPVWHRMSHKHAHI
jgi:uncharacterized membrane protein YtjA (UPF0391 family)